MLDRFSRDFGMGILEDAGSISHEAAVDKAYREYDAYRVQLSDELTDVERAYLDTLRDMQKKLKEGSHIS